MDRSRRLGITAIRVDLDFGRVDGLDVERRDVLDTDVLGLELPAETRAVKGGTEDGGFIGVDIDCNLGSTRRKKSATETSRDRCTHSPTAALTAV